MNEAKTPIIGQGAIDNFEIRYAIAIFRQYGPEHAFIFPVILGDCEIPRIEIDDVQTLDRLRCIDIYPEKKGAAGVQKLPLSLKTAPGRS